MYKLAKDFAGEINYVQRLSDNAFIPFDPMNTDYQKFKSDVLAGATLEDTTGAAMTASAATAFVQGLP